MEMSNFGRFWSMHAVRALGASGLALTMLSTGASAQNVLNGDFAPNAGSAYVKQGSATPNTLPSWTVTSASGYACVASATSVATSGGSVCGNMTMTSTSTGLPGGTANVFVDDAGTGDQVQISQIITGLVSGYAYSLSFYYAGAQQTTYSGTSQDDWFVTAASCTSPTGCSTTANAVNNGALGPNPTTITIPPSPAANFAQSTLNFIVAPGSTSETISFLATGNGPGGQPPFMYLADVAVKPIPEPATIALLGLGLAGLAGLRRRGQVAAA